MEFTETDAGGVSPLLSKSDLKTVYLTCETNLLNLIRRGVPTETDAEDIVQDVFAAFFQRTPETLSVQQARYYLVRCAMNQIAQWWRNHERREQPVPNDFLASRQSPQPSPRERAIQEETLSRLDYAVAQLPDRQQQAVSLHYFAELSVEETAAVMQCEAATIRSHIRHGIQQLKEQFHEPEPCEDNQGVNVL